MSKIRGAERMTFNRITTKVHPLYPYATELYKISFPIHEQREALSQRNILKEKEYHYDAVCDGTIFILLFPYLFNVGRLLITVSKLRHGNFPINYSAIRRV